MTYNFCNKDLTENYKKNFRVGDILILKELILLTRCNERKIFCLVLCNSYRLSIKISFIQKFSVHVTQLMISL